VEAWDQGLPGISFDIRFDKGEGEFQGIALRAKVLEDVDWPEVPDIDTLAKQVHDVDSDGYMRWSGPHSHSHNEPSCQPVPIQMQTPNWPSLSWVTSLG